MFEEGDSMKKQSTKIKDEHKQVLDQHEKCTKKMKSDLSLKRIAMIWRRKSKSFLTKSHVTAIAKIKEISYQDPVCLLI